MVIALVLIAVGILGILAVLRRILTSLNAGRSETNRYYSMLAELHLYESWLDLRTRRATCDVRCNERLVRKELERELGGGGPC
jgi:Tfp pilus assembly protein PilV